MVELRFHGLGGQGAVTLSYLLAKAGDRMGRYVQAFPFFGAERRGAPVKSYLRMDERPIYLRSQIYRPDFVVVMNLGLTEAAISEGTKEDTVLIFNATAEEEARLTHLDFPAYRVDATSIALELGMEVEGMPLVNVPFLGAVAHVTGLVNMEAIAEVLRETYPPDRAELSLEAARRGFTSVVKFQEAKEKGQKAASGR
jgi:2-oxoacid:acceptor oxidoreductase gamma subunit (pyruvate/2-ketoisovalerate family)